MFFSLFLLNCSMLIGSGTLPGKMLLEWFIENNKTDAFLLGQVRLIKGYLCSSGLGKGLR